MVSIYTSIAFVVYAAFLLCVGLYFYIKTKNATDFIIGDRSVNYWVTAIGAQASDMGSWLFFGFPAAVFSNGIAEIYTALGLVLGMFLNWHFIAPQLRIKTGILKNLTLTSFFSSQFNDRNHVIRTISALICIIFFVFYIASGLVGLGRVFESAFEIEYHQGVIFGLLVTGVYTLLGGFCAIAWSNLFQGVFLLCMIIIVPIAAFFSLPAGITSIALAAQDKSVPLLLSGSPADLGNAALLALSWGLGYFGQPHILVYFMGIDDPKNITYAKYVGIAWQIIVLTAAVVTGVIGLAFFMHTIPHPIELLFVFMAKTLFHPLLVGFVLCAIFAAILTTLNGHILIAGSVLAYDICAVRKHMTSKNLLLLSRLSSLVIALISLAIAWHNNSSIYNLVNYAWSGLGSSFGPLVIAGCYLNRPSFHAGLWGMITGAVVSGIWPLLGIPLMPLIPGFACNMLVLMLIQTCTKK